MEKTVQEILKSSQDYCHCLSCGEFAIWHEIDLCPTCGKDTLVPYGNVVSKELLEQSFKDFELDKVVRVY